MNSKLAIIIPAYKETFLERTLLSIAKQTNKNFTVYIGDDCSPFDLFKIVKKFKNEVEIKYVRFDENLGGKDLVRQWSRCIELSENEEWIWLFSDDDEMEANCVEVFFKVLEQYEKNELFHFNLEVINENQEVLNENLEFSTKISSKEFFYLKSRGKIKSYVVEYIFSRKVYEKLGGFVNFDLAWFTDDATWIKFGYDHNIISIPDGKVLWRRSSENISPKKDHNTIKRKLHSCMAYFIWVENFFRKKNDPLTKVEVRRGFRYMIRKPSIDYPFLGLIRMLSEFHKGNLLFFLFDCSYLLAYRILKKISG